MVNRCLCLALAIASLTVTQEAVAQKQPLIFRGKVEQVNAAAKRITVNGENVEGWMAPMTMAYPVAKAEILATLKPGDLITAKVYPGDMSLHDVEVVSAPGTAAPGGLSLVQLEQMALAGNPTAAQVQANLRAATALAKQAGLDPNPPVG